MDLTSLRWRIVPLLLCASLQSCGGTKTDATPGGQATQPVVAPNRVGRLPDLPLPLEFSQQDSILQKAPALRYLPATTVALALSDSAIQLAQTLETSAILDSYPDVRNELNMFRTGSGTGLFFPETWEKSGIDSNAQAGISLSLVDNRPVGFFFATIKNKEVVLETLKTISSSQQIRFESIGLDESGDFFAQWENSSTAVVVRENTLILLVTDSEETMEATRKYFQQAAVNENFATALKGNKLERFDFGRKLAGFVNFPEIAAWMAKQFNHLQSQSDKVEHLEELVTAAMNEGGENDVGLAKARLETEMKWYRKRQLAQTGERLAIRLYLSSLGLSPLGVILDGGTTRFRVQLTATPKSGIASLFTANTSTFALPSRLQETPVFMVAGHFRVSEFLSMIEPLFYFDGTTLKQFKHEAEKYSQVDADALISQFDGELSGALTLNLEAEHNEDNLPFGVHFLAHLRDPAIVQSILDTLGKHKAFQKYAKTVQGNTVLDIPAPKFAKTIYGNTVLDTTAPPNSALIRVRVDGEFLEAKSLRGQTSTVQWKQAEQGMLTQPGSRALMVLDPTLFGLLMIGDYSYDGDYSDDRDYSYDGMSDHSAAKLKGLHEKLKEARKGLNSAILRRITQTSTQFGRLVFTAHNKDGGYALLGGLFGKSINLGRGIQALVEVIEPDFEHFRTRKIPEVRTMQREYVRLQDELLLMIGSPYF